MTEARAPRERQALALVNDERFHRWLDSRVTTSRSNSWPHNRVSATAWLLKQLGIESLGHLAVSPRAAQAFDEIERRFALWDKNQELPV
ncbi:hypothetical protein HOP60_09850 [Halomonas daqingensis]|uniref:Uncharacterized protein n=1 Tax=Billgrantia desiderata TaxID=52021 RepID=A0ABS9B4M5_9GAMM|nr:hypothetical protein [Halomonas desiderata]MCE8042456.1 hypothetical protein [Halomonas desiderata]MCE8047031.1 hypothetical protein [Halomonas desiderata]